MKSGRVAVIGAGLAGLNAARNLNGSGHDVVVFESTDRLGGRVTSDLIDGYICDRGFQVINPAYSELRETGLVTRLKIRSLPKGICLVDGNEEITVGDPRTSLRFMAGALSPRSGSVKEKVAFLRYLIKETEDITFGAAMNELGSFYDRVLAPFLRGVFLQSPDEVSNRMARELIHWFVKGKPGLPEGGVRKLPELLGEGLTIRFNSRVESISGRTIHSSSGSESFDAIIVAADPICSADLLGVKAPNMTRCTTWYHSLPKGALSSDLLRTSPNSPIINSVLLSASAPDYAPKGRALLSTTSLNPLSDVEVKTHLRNLWRADVESWDLVARYEIEKALPEHLPGQELLQPLDLGNGTYVAGDWRSIPAQQGALLTGRLVAAKVRADLQAR